MVGGSAAGGVAGDFADGAVKHLADEAVHEAFEVAAVGGGEIGVAGGEFVEFFAGEAAGLLEKGADLRAGVAGGVPGHELFDMAGEEGVGVFDFGRAFVARLAAET